MKNLLFTILIIIFSQNLFSQADLSNEVKQEFIQRHNYYRSEQGAVDIKWSDDLAQEANKWVVQIAKEDKMMHSNMEYGENIYTSTDIVSPSHVVDRWASEKDFYHGEKISTQNFHLFGHYTQIIWNSTREVGCAMAVSKSGKYYWVCEYSPSGNYIDETPVKNYKD